jgi:hypothetical protein
MSPPSAADARACDEIEALLPLVADGSLHEQQDPGLFDHLARCERCQDSLASHDLVTLALEQRPQAAAPRILRPHWSRWIPAAAAAVLAVGAGTWFVTGEPTTSVPAAHVPGIAKATTHPAPVTPAVPAGTTAVTASSTPATATAPTEIEVEVVTVPGSSPSHPRYLVRRGDQVLLVDPAHPAVESTGDARPASFRY